MLKLVDNSHEKHDIFMLVISKYVKMLLYQAQLQKKKVETSQWRKLADTCLPKYLQLKSPGMRQIDII